MRHRFSKQALPMPALPIDALRSSLSFPFAENRQTAPVVWYHPVSVYQHRDRLHDIYPRIPIICSFLQVK